MIGLIFASFFLGIFVCVVFYFAVILPVMNEDCRELERNIFTINYLRDKNIMYYDKIINQQKQLCSLQKKYEKLKNSVDNKKIL